MIGQQLFCVKVHWFREDGQSHCSLSSHMSMELLAMPNVDPTRLVIKTYSIICDIYICECSTKLYNEH